MRKVNACNIVTGDVLRLRDVLDGRLEDVEVISKRVAMETVHLTVDDGRTLQFGYDYSLNVVDDVPEPDPLGLTCETCGGPVEDTKAGPEHINPEDDTHVVVPL